MSDVIRGTIVPSISDKNPPVCNIRLLDLILFFLSLKPLRAFLYLMNLCTLFFVNLIFLYKMLRRIL